MYRKRFEPQLTHLPQNYCGWAAEGGAECADLPAEACTENKPALPCTVKKELTRPGTHLLNLTRRSKNDADGTVA